MVMRPAAPHPSIHASMMAHKGIQVKSKSNPSSWYRLLFLLTNSLMMAVMSGSLGVGKKEERGAESCWWAAEGPDWGSTSSSRGSPLRPLLLLLLRLLLRGLPGEARVRPGGRGLRDKGEGKAGMRPSRPHTSVTVYPAVGRLPRHRTLVPASRSQLSRASWVSCSSEVTGKDY